MTTPTKSQLMRQVAQGKLTETFTHVTLGTFDVTRLRAIVRDMKKAGERPHTCRFSDLRRADGASSGADLIAWLVSERDVDMARVKELSPSQINEPVINAVDPDGSHYPVDGLHRLVRRVQEGRVDFRYWAVPLAQCPRLSPGLHLDVQWGAKAFVDGKLVPREN